MKRVVTYSVAPRINPRDKEAAPKYYGTAVSTGKVDLEEMAEQISKRCTVKTADVMGVIKAFEDQFRSALLNGEIVDLNGIGRFRVTLTGKGAATEEDFDPSLIKGVYVRFHPAKKLREVLGKLKYGKVPRVTEPKKDDGEGGEDLTS